MTTGKTIALTRWTFVDKVMSLLFNKLSRLVITFLPRSKRLLISWLQSPSAVILEPPKIKSVTVSCFPMYLGNMSPRDSGRISETKGGDQGLREGLRDQEWGLEILCPVKVHVPGLSHHCTSCGFSLCVPEWMHWDGNPYQPL